MRSIAEHFIHQFKGIQLPENWRRYMTTDSRHVVGRSIRERVSVMQILVTTDNHTEGHARLHDYVQTKVETTLARFQQRVTRAEVHLSDQNSSAKKSDDHQKCVVEVRVNGLKPMSVSHNASNLELAVTGAVEKMERALAHTLDRLAETHKSGSPKAAGLVM
jgi:Sigma 54 modulation protein / S30EA ribosomal protein.